jgi:hypothetical protein
MILEATSWDGVRVGWPQRLRAPRDRQECDRNTRRHGGSAL